MSATCLYPHRNTTTGQFCRARGFRVPDYPHTLCAHHIGVVRQRQCEAVWPSPVTGGMTDAQCVETATVQSEGEWFCDSCAIEVSA